MNLLRFLVYVVRSLDIFREIKPFGGGVDIYAERTVLLPPIRKLHRTSVVLSSYGLTTHTFTVKDPKAAILRLKS